eukprot:gene13017-biopygen4372
MFLTEKWEKNDTSGKTYLSLNREDTQMKQHTQIWEPAEAEEVSSGCESDESPSDAATPADGSSASARKLQKKMSGSVLFSENRQIQIQCRGRYYQKEITDGDALPDETAYSKLPMAEKE